MGKAFAGMGGLGAVDLKEVEAHLEEEVVAAGGEPSPAGHQALAWLVEAELVEPVSAVPTLSARVRAQGCEGWSGSSY